MCGGSEAVERRSERGDTAYSPRAPRGGAFGHRRTNRKPRNRACRVTSYTTCDAKEIAKLPAMAP